MREIFPKGFVRMPSPDEQKDTAGSGRAETEKGREPEQGGTQMKFKYKNWLAALAATSILAFGAVGMADATIVQDEKIAELTCLVEQLAAKG